MNRTLFSFIILLSIICQGFAHKKPIKLGVIGMSHDHINWLFRTKPLGDYTIEGIVETNEKSIALYIKRFKLDRNIIFSSPEELLAKKNIDAVMSFGSVYSHMEVVEFFAPKGIHVMLEKPMAVNFKHAKKMENLALEHNIHLITNYETTWYPTNHEAYKLAKRDSVIGKLNKIIVRDGHKGPKRIRVTDEFLSWLTDPELNGGGAITDFGCYGVNLVTWLMENEKPKSVTAITQQLQKENNPNVDDESVIILQYENLVALIQPSWNWPIGRKDMELHGYLGSILVDNKKKISVHISKGYDKYDEEVKEFSDRDYPYKNPFSYFSAVVRGDIKVSPKDLSSLENNMISMEILSAAIKSAKKRKTVFLKK